MRRDVAIDEIRQTRHEISERFGHDTRALIEHYQALESKYADRIIRSSSPSCLAEPKVRKDIAPSSHGLTP